MTNRFDQYREDVIGRANVADTPALVDYYRRLSELGTGALWTVANKIEPWEPVSTSVPMLWRYADLRDHVLKALDLSRRNRRGVATAIWRTRGGPTWSPPRQMRSG